MAAQSGGTDGVNGWLRKAEERMELTDGCVKLGNGYGQRMAAQNGGAGKWGWFYPSSGDLTASPPRWRTWV